MSGPEEAATGNPCHYNDTHSHETLVDRNRSDNQKIVGVHDQSFSLCDSHSSVYVDVDILNRYKALMSQY